ncbi:DUF3253 domain-containing protein [Actinoplanes sp. M2I2]|uniref:DUF3253 domain-containing protein n=1 Tax=Actinoplanes sp. M2I2 TaxID=1734444 RepID=UPI0020209F8F|nr:DUF3253 domain-containing protein [Actinoplanes sp. M2I2]
MEAGEENTESADGRQPADPAVPEPLRRELVSELTAARQLASEDPEAAGARARDAEVALGQRGGPWGEPTADGRRERLAAAMLALLRHRRPESTICPSDAARVAGGASWRDLMDTARDVAAELARDGTIAVRQGGADVDVTTAIGPVRLARGPGWRR